MWTLPDTSPVLPGGAGLPPAGAWQPPAPRTSVESEPAASARPTGLGRLADWTLTAAALLGLLVLGLTVYAQAAGLQPLVVRSGSMEPTIPTGSMVLVRSVPASELRVGDVVTVGRPDRTRVTHRIVSVEQQGATASLVLKGDANEDVDPQPVTVAEAGRLVLTAPLLGRVGAFAASAKGGFVLGCLVTAVLVPLLQRRRA